MAELWDAYKKDGSLAGCDLVRGEKIPEGLYHMAVEIIVKHKDGTYLLMQRDKNKIPHPGLYESSAGGSALKGESPYEAAMRELGEETGIKADSLAEIYHVITRNTIFYGYLCVTECNKDSITLQEGETISYQWMDKDDFLKFVESDKFIESKRNRLKDYFNSIK